MMMQARTQAIQNNHKHNGMCIKDCSASGVKYNETKKKKKQEK